MQILDNSSTIIFKKQVTDGRFYFGRISSELENEDEAFFILDEKTAILQVFDSLCQINPTDYYILSGSVVVIDFDRDLMGPSILNNKTDRSYFIVNPPKDTKKRKFIP